MDITKKRKAISLNIKRLRESRGMSRYKLAKEAGLASSHTVDQVEAGDTAYTVDTILKIQHVLGVDLIAIK